MVAQVFHFYAGAVDKHYGDTIPVAGGDRRDLPRAARRRRPDHALELPAQHRELEGRAGARNGQHDRLKPAELTPLTTLRLAELALEAGIPEGVAQRRRRQGLGRRAAARRASGRGQDRLHRLDRGGAAGDGGRRRDDQAGHARARRQVGQRRLRRCRPGAGRRLGAVLGLRQRRPGLLRALAHPRRAERLRPLRGAARRGDAGRQGRRPRGRGDRDGAADLGRAPRDRGLVRRGRAALPRRGTGREGVLVPVHARRGRERRPRRARGGVRPRGRGDPVRRRGGGGADRERHALRALGLDLDARRRACDPRRARRSSGRAVRQLEQLRAGARRRSAA